MSDLVDGAMLRLGQFASAGEGVFFEEEADFVAAGQEVGVADVGGFFSGGEFGHGVVGEREGGEHFIRLGEESGHGGGGEGVGDDEVAIGLVGSELLGGKLCRYSGVF